MSSNTSEISKYSHIRYKVLGALMLGSILGPIDASIVNVVLPTMADIFNSSIALAQWVPLIYLLTISSLLLFYGRLGDILGYRRIFLVGLAFFTVTSGLCGLAPSMHWLIVFRALQGIGSGMVMSVPFAILTAVFRPEERGRAMGISAVSISVGLALGPTLGGLLTSLWSWRLIFLINIPIGIVALWWGARVIPELKGKYGSIDIGGASSAFVFLFCVLFFMNHVITAGLNLLTVSAIVVAVVSGMFFVYIEKRQEHPMLNFSMFANRTFSLSLISAFLNYASQYILVFLTPFYLQRIAYYSPDRIGYMMTCFPLAVMTMAPLSGAISDKIGTRIPAIVGASICTLGMLGTAFLSTDASPLSVAWRLAVFGLGTGIFQSPNNSSVMGNAPRMHLGTASGVLATARNTGMAAGIAAAGMILYSIVPPSIMATEHLSGQGAEAFLKGLKFAYLLGAVFSLSAAVLSSQRAGRPEVSGRAVGIESRVSEV